MQIFKWLMALVVMMCVPMILECFKNFNRSDYRHSEEHLKERVKDIYSHVMLFYNRLGTLRKTDGLVPTEWPDFDRLYCTDDWNRKLAAVLQKEEKQEGGQGFFDWNYWLCAPDCDLLWVTDVEVIDKTGDQGTVSLVLHNGDSLAVPVLLNMVYERKDWRIDEITNNWNHHPHYRHYEWKHEMAAYLSASSQSLS